MSFTIKPVTVEAFSIAASVGKEGVNEDDDVLTVKELLNRVERTRGGAEGTLNSSDSSKQGPEWEKTVSAIVFFQQFHFSGQFTPDGLIQPDKSTIQRLRTEFLKKNNAGIVGVREATPLSGLSKARLKRLGNSTGFAVDSNQPFCQMVPKDGIRNLLVSTSNAADRITLSLPPNPHSATFAAPGVVTVRGLSEGDDLGTFKINAAASNQLRVIVRDSFTVTVHFHALANTKTNQGATGFDGEIDGLLQELNRIYVNQTNIKFKRGPFKVVDTLAGSAIDFTKPIVIDSGNPAPGPIAGANQTFPLGAFVPIAINVKKELNCVIVPNMETKQFGHNAGTSSPRDELLCWVQASTLHNTQIRARLLGHEIGHLLRLSHLDDFPGTLMFPGKALGELIPAETLETIKIP